MDHLTRPDGSAPGDLHVTRRAAASLLVAGYAVAALSAEAAPIVTPATGLLIAEATIPDGAGGLPTFVARPIGSGRHAAILVVNEVFGVHDYIKDVCRRLARLGYVAIAPAFFHRSKVDLPATRDMAAIMKVVAATPDAQVDADVRAATAWLRAQPFVKAAAIGVTGFCWGGAVTWRAAMTDPDVRAGVAWYGRLAALVPRAGEVRAPVLGLYGGKDQGIPQSDVAAMRAALAKAGRSGSSILVYPDAPHGFHADYRDSYTPAAAEDGWKRMLAHFRRYGVA